VERKSQFYSKTDTLRMEGLSSSKLQLGTSGTGRAFIRRCVEQDLHKPGCVAFFFFFVVGTWQLTLTSKASSCSS
jgi:hypothetical protein